VDPEPEAAGRFVEAEPEQHRVGAGHGLHRESLRPAPSAHPLTVGRRAPRREGCGASGPSRLSIDQ
jgi:hypothetical protein